MSDTPETDKIITDWRQGVTKDLPNFVDIARKLERERDEAREKLEEEIKFHHRTHTELVHTQCKILDMQMGRDEIQEKYDTLATEHMLEVNKICGERDELRSIVEQRLVAGATIHQNANDLMRRNERLESERDEFSSVIKSLRKNAKEDAAKLSIAVELVKKLVLQIEYPAYTVDEAVDKMFLMESARNFINEVS